MGSFSADLSSTPEECFATVQRIIGTNELETKSVIANQSIIAEGGRDFSWVWIIVFVILFWPVVIIYYFTRKKNTLSVSITKREDGCSISATSSGKKGDSVLQTISGSVK